jgi:hypothetical protein
VALACPCHALALPNASVKEEMLAEAVSPGGSREPAEDTKAAWQWHVRSADVMGSKKVDVT